MGKSWVNKGGKKGKKGGKILGYKGGLRMRLVCEFVPSLRGLLKG